MEASGHARWFERMLSELQFELCIGDAAKIRAKRNRYENASNELQARGRKRYCGSRTLRGRSLEAQAEKAVRLDCKSWDCDFCAPRKAWRYKQAIRDIAERHSLTRFLTLTLDPSKIDGDPVRYLRRVFNKFRVSLLRKFGCSVTYIAILEFHKSGIPHLHVLIDRFVLQRWISESWSALGGGHVVDIRFVDVHRISHYLAKYLTKELLMSAPLRSRRVTTSRSIHLLERKPSDTTWVVDERSSLLYCLTCPSFFLNDRRLTATGDLPPSHYYRISTSAFDGRIKVWCGTTSKVKSPLGVSSLSSPPLFA